MSQRLYLWSDLRSDHCPHLFLNIRHFAAKEPPTFASRSHLDIVQSSAATELLPANCQRVRFHCEPVWMIPTDVFLCSYFASRMFCSMRWRHSKRDGSCFDHHVIDSVPSASLMKTEPRGFHHRKKRRQTSCELDAASIHAFWMKLIRAFVKPRRSTNHFTTIQDRL